MRAPSHVALAVCGLLLCLAGASAQRGSTVLAPGYEFNYNVHDGILEGELHSNLTCWAGIGISPDQSMQNATVFVIGTAANNAGLVATYKPSTAPLGHAPPVITPDQSAIKNFYVNFDSYGSHYHFTTTLVNLVNANTRIWAFCAADKTLALTYHGNNHQ